MESSHLQRLHAVCKRAGPGRLPGADSADLGAGYAAATAAIAATALYGVVLIVYAGATEPSALVGTMLFVTAAMPVVVPAAFVVGIVGWRLMPTTSDAVGALTGIFGVVATYAIATALTVALVTLAAGLSITGATLADAVRFGIGLGAVAVVLTWWLTLPIGCVAGYVYTSVVAE